MQTPSRPARIRITDELGRVRTLDSGAVAFECLRAGTEGTLLLGLGPNPAAFVNELTAKLDLKPPVFWVESDDFERRMPQEWHRAIPKDWIRLHAGAQLPKAATVWLYRANPRLFPSFWGPITAQVLSMESRQALSMESQNTPRAAAMDSAPVVLLPGSENQLLTQELEAAFRAEGFTPMRLPENDSAALRAMLVETRPALYFSVNFRGMDADGLVFHLLREHGVPVVAWLVDNPWHVLSRFRQPWWRQVSLFVTDDWFVPGLVAHGAADVHHLPLAAWDIDLTPASPLPETRLTFVGSARFPNKDAFFAGLTIPGEHLAAAREVLNSAQFMECPHLGWWLERLQPAQLWPGTEVRLAGLCADTVSCERRIHWLSYASRFGLTIYGDPLWHACVPRVTRCLSPVDYYHGLGAIYATARYSLNITSLQLPRSLSQRHFDVWQAGGFLLSDPTPGLSLFPAELTELVTVPDPSGFRAVLRRLEKDSTLRSDLQRAWRAHIQEHHTYRHRVRVVLERVCR